MLRKIIIGAGILLSLTTHASGGMCRQPLEFIRTPSSPKQVIGTTLLRYTIRNNTKFTLPLSFPTPSVSAGSISVTTSAPPHTTCGATLLPNASCTVTYLYTAPANTTSQPLTVTGNLQINYNSRYPLTDSIKLTVPPEGTALAFIEEPTSPISVTPTSSGDPIETDYTKLYYAVVNNSHDILTINTISLSGPNYNTAVEGSCSTISTLNPGQTCTIVYGHAPSAPPSNTDTMTLKVDYSRGGTSEYIENTITFNVTPDTEASISVPQHSLMFVSRDFGNTGSNYTGKLRILNNGNSGTTPITGISTSISAGSNITLTSSSANCTNLAAGDTCTETFSSPIPVNTNATIQLTPSNTNGTGATLTIPVSALGVVALAPPTDSSVDLTLVNTCTDTTHDGGLVMITNNSNEHIENISIGSSTSINADITSTHNNDSDIYCTGNQITPNKYCEFRAQTIKATSTGEIPIFATLVKSDGTLESAHLYSMPVKVVDPTPSIATPTYGDTLFTPDTNCNLVEVAKLAGNTGGTYSWAQAANNCTNLSAGGYNDWHLPDVGPTPGYVSAPDSDIDVAPTGELGITASQYFDFSHSSQSYSPINGALGPPSIYHNIYPVHWTAWVNQSQQFLMTLISGGIYGNPTICIRSYTTDENGN